jgi:hypothetical protein
MNLQFAQTENQTIPHNEETDSSFRNENNSTIFLYQAVREHLCCELNGEAVILSLKNGKYYGLNSIGADIWELLQKPVRFSKITKEILSEYDVEEEECRREIENFLAQMKDEGLVEVINVPIAQIREAANGRKDTIY